MLEVFATHLFTATVNSYALNETLRTANMRNTPSQAQRVCRWTMLFKVSLTFPLDHFFFLPTTSHGDLIFCSFVFCWTLGGILTFKQGKQPGDRFMEMSANIGKPLGHCYDRNATRASAGHNHAHTHTESRSALPRAQETPPLHKRQSLQSYRFTTTQHTSRVHSPISATITRSTLCRADAR